MQGAGSVPKRAFGSAGIPRGLRGWDATCTQHLALPRATGPYTVVRTTRNVSTSAVFGFAGAFADMNAAGVGALEHPTWTNICFLEDAVLGPVNATNATRRYVMPMDFGPGASVAPAAVTVQVLCPTALQTASGMLYLGRSHAQYDLAGDTRAWSELGDFFVSYMAPRMCSAAKLALRGVKMSSYPLDMSALADFRSLEQVEDTTFTWANSNRKAPEGFAPLVVFNPNGAELNLLITIEWRVRFDLGNPAAASHRTHAPTTDAMWSKMSAAAHSMGHGVEDIVEDVATLGAESLIVTGAAAAL